MQEFNLIIEKEETADSDAFLPIKGVFLCNTGPYLTGMSGCQTRDKTSMIKLIPLYKSFRFRVDS